MRDSGHTVVLWIIGGGVGTLVLFSVMIYAWGCFLDAHDHEMTRVRSILLSFVVVTAAMEILLTGFGVLVSWALVVVLVIDVWGNLDAVLRFPGWHRLESPFALKQITFIVLKTASCMLGFNNLKQNIVVFFLLVVMDAWGMPLLYLMALPMDAAEQSVISVEDDIDIVVHVWRLISSPWERHRCLHNCRRAWYRRIVMACEYCPILRRVLGDTSKASKRSRQRV